MRTLFKLYEPRADVLGGNVGESEFAADRAAALCGSAPDEYVQAPVLIANTLPTEGLKRLLDNVGRCLVDYRKGERTKGKGPSARTVRPFGFTDGDCSPC